MNEEDVKAMLDQFAEYESAIDLTQLRKKEAIDAVLTDEQRNQIEAINIEFDQGLETAQEKLAELKKQLSEAVLVLGHSVKGAHKQIQFVKASPKWNTDGLMKLANEYPAIKAFMTEGVPSTRLVNNK